MCLSQIHVFFNVEGLRKPSDPYVSTFNTAFQVVQWIKWHTGLGFCLSVEFELGKFRRRVSDLFFQTDTSIPEPSFFIYMHCNGLLEFFCKLKAVYKCIPLQYYFLA